MKIVKKKTIEYELATLSEEEKKSIEKIINEVKKEEKKPVDPERLKSVKKMKKGEEV